MNEYLTIKEVCDLTGKSDKTVRNHFTSKKESINLLSKKDVIIKKGREYGILKSFVLNYYGLETGKSPEEKTEETGKKKSFTRQKESNSGKNDVLLVELRNQLKDKEEQVVYLRKQIDKKDQVISDQIMQSYNSQEIIKGLQMANSAKLLGDGNTIDEDVSTVAPEKEKVKEKTSLWWMIISLLLIAGLIALAIYLFYI